MIYLVIKEVDGQYESTKAFESLGKAQGFLKETANNVLCTNHYHRALELREDDRLLSYIEDEDAAVGEDNTILTVPYLVRYNIEAHELL